jgi:hypothetical protein
MKLPYSGGTPKDNAPAPKAEMAKVGLALSQILIEVAELEANVAPSYAASRSNCSASERFE